MGNIKNKEAQIDVSSEGNEVLIEMDKTKFYLGDKITGNIVINYRKVIQMSCLIYVKVIGIESANYYYLKGCSTNYKYNIGPRKFFKCKKILAEEEILTEGYQDIQFTIQPLVKSPTVEFKQSDFDCKIEYQVIAKVIWKQRGKRRITQRVDQPIVFVKKFVREPEKTVEKLETITTYKQFRMSRAPVFTYLRVNKTQITNDEHLTVEVGINNQYTKMNIRSAKLLFYLEFIFKEKIFQGMPKYLIQERDFQQIQKDEQQHTVTFIIRKQDNIPHQSVGEKVGCRHIVVLQLIFEKQCFSVDDVEIIQQIEYYPSEDQILAPENQNLNLKNEVIRHMNGKESIELSNVPSYIEESYIFDEKTRLAHLTQIIKNEIQ